MSDMNFNSNQENPPSYINFNIFKGTEIVKAISIGYESLQTYLKSHPNPHLEVNKKTTSNDLTPLHWAAYCNNPQMIELLLEYGAHPNDSVLTGQTPLFILLDNITQKDPTQSLECMKILLNKDIDVNKIIDNSHTPLTILFDFQWIRKSTFKDSKKVFFDFKPFLSLFLEHGAEVNPQVAMPPMVKLYWCDIFLKKARETREMLEKNDQPQNFFLLKYGSCYRF